MSVTRTEIYTDKAPKPGGPYSQVSKETANFNNFTQY